MYVPTPFQPPDQSAVFDLMRTHGFAVLFSGSAAEPALSHLPLLLDPSAGPNGTLWGHFARANDHWRSADGQPAVAVFSGPHTYISPTWYGEPDLVPTWNYLAVHAHGRLALHADPDTLWKILDGLAAYYESDGPNPWSPADRRASLEKLLAGVVGFSIPIDRLEGKWKLNQHHPPVRRQRVVDELRRSGRENDRAIADWMERTNGG